MPGGTQDCQRKSCRCNQALIRMRREIVESGSTQELALNDFHAQRRLVILGSQGINLLLRRTNTSDTQRTGNSTKFMSKPAPLYDRTEVISCLGIKTSDFADYCYRGIIPPPVGREGNAYRWNSTIIKAVAASILIEGSDHTKRKTVDILFKDLVKFEES